MMEDLTISRGWFRNSLVYFLNRDLNIFALFRMKMVVQNFERHIDMCSVGDLADVLLYLPFVMSLCNTKARLYEKT